MARRKAAVPVAVPVIEEKILTVFEFNGESYSTREEAERAVLIEKITRLTDSGDDALIETDLYREDVVSWIAGHLEDLLALRSTT